MANPQHDSMAAETSSDLVRAIQEKVAKACEDAAILASAPPTEPAPPPLTPTRPHVLQEPRPAWSRGRAMTTPRTSSRFAHTTTTARVRELEERLAVATRALDDRRTVLAERVERAAQLRTALDALAEDVARLSPDVQARLDAQAKTTADLIQQFQALRIEFDAAHAPPTSEEEVPADSDDPASAGADADPLAEIREQLALQTSRLDAQRTEMDALLRDVIDQQRKTIASQSAELDRLRLTHAQNEEQMQDAARMAERLEHLEDDAASDHELIEAAQNAFAYLLHIYAHWPDTLPSYPGNLDHDISVLKQRNDWFNIADSFELLLANYTPSRATTTATESEDDGFQIV